MASTLNALLGALGAAAFWTCIGLALGRRTLPAPLAWPFAPALGWAVHSAATFPVLTIVGFSTRTVAIIDALALIASLGALYRDRSTRRAPADCRSSYLSWLGAALLACGIAIAILPKTYGDSVILSEAIFDHSKLAMIDEMVRMGLPPGNPFFGADTPRLTYYYLYYFSAAGLAHLTGLSGWEAEAALTWFAAFSSLTAMIGVAGWFAGRAAALWVLPLAIAASLRPVLHVVLGDDAVGALLLPPEGFVAWQSHAAWAPQHLMAANCVVVAILLLDALARRQSVALVATLALVAVAAFESSAYVGGILLTVALGIAGAVMLVRAEPAARSPFVVSVVIAGVLALGLAVLFLHDQLQAARLRGDPFPIALTPYEVLGPAFSDSWRRMLDIPAFWLVLLPIHLPAIYLTGIYMLVWTIRSTTIEPEKHRVAIGLAALTVASLLVSALLASTIANNDLGWRAVLPAAMVLTAFAAIALARWIAARNVIAVAAALFLLGLGLPEGLARLHENAVGKPAASGVFFARAPELWAAVRRHAADDERVGNNPGFLGDLTPWNVNISWSLLANRRSCFASEPLVLAFAPIPSARRHEINRQFLRVFNGEGSLADVRALADEFDCRVIVLTAQDEAWKRDPFAASGLYRLVEEKPDAWRIYRRAPAASR